MIYIEQLSKTFHTVHREIEAVKQVDFKMDEPAFHQIIGRSGSGKSTLLHLMTGLLRPTSGKIIICGQDYADLSEDALAKCRNQHIGFISQQATLLSALTVIENIVLPWYLLGKRDGDPYGRARLLLDSFEIRHLEKAQVRELSGGELRRVQIVRALINQPDLLIADEPTSDLDAESTKLVMNALVSCVQRGMGVVAVTHELDTLAYGDKVWTMSEGRLSAGNGFADEN